MPLIQPLVRLKSSWRPRLRPPLKAWPRGWGRKKDPLLSWLLPLLASCGPLPRLSKYPHNMAAGNWRKKETRTESEGETERKMEATIFLYANLESNTSSLLPYFIHLKAAKWVQPTPKGKGLHTWVTTERQRSLEAVLKAYLPHCSCFLSPKVRPRVWASQVRLKGWKPVCGINNFSDGWESCRISGSFIIFLGCYLPWQQMMKWKV